MKAQDYSNVIAFPLAKANKARIFNVLDAEWRSLKKNEGKKVSDREIQTLWTIIRLANHYQTNEIKIDYAFLMKQCAFGCSQDQMRRYLKGLKETKIIQYKIENEQFNYEKKLAISVDVETLKSLLPSMFAEQVCTANLPTYNKEENRFKNKEKERALKSNLSFSKKEKIKNKKEKEENETQFLAAAGSLDEPAAKNEFLPTTEKQSLEQAETPASTEALPPTETTHQMTAEEEQEHYLAHRHRTPSFDTKEPCDFKSIAGICKDVLERPTETSEQEKGVESQPEVENSPSNAPSETHISTSEQKKVDPPTYGKEWVSISREFEEAIGEQVYKMVWLSRKPRIVQNCDEKTITIGLISDFFKICVEQQYLPKLSELAAKHGDYKIKLEVKHD